MTWNYQAIRETQHGETTYSIYEVYYNKAGEIENVTADPVHAQGETVEELRDDLTTMLHDVGKHPVLDMEELRKRFPETPHRTRAGGGYHESGRE